MLPTMYVALAAILGAGRAGAAVYAVVQSSPDEIIVLDPASIEKIPGGDWRRAATVDIKRNLVSGGPPQPGYVRTVSEYDCTARRLRWRTFSVYSEFGASVMHKDNDDLGWLSADNDGGLRTVCGDGGGQAVVSAPSLPQLVIGLMRTWDEGAPLPPQPAVPAAASTPAKKKKLKVQP